jgi:hypothetical protein
MKKFNENFIRISKEEWQNDADTTRIEVWRCEKYLVQIFQENAVKRLSVNKTKQNSSGRWKDGITWDELMKIKNDCGFKNFWAVEIYPPHNNVVNVSNMRHLWILNKKPSFAW